MKSDIAYYLLLLYVTVMLKPLIPIISDAWSHEFNEIEHVSTVHAKFGSQHLQKDLADERSDNKDQNSLKSQDQVAFHIPQNETTFYFGVTSFDREFHFLKFQKILPAFISKHIPPPKFSW